MRATFAVLYPHIGEAIADTAARLPPRQAPYGSRSSAIAKRERERSFVDDCVKFVCRRDGLKAFVVHFAHFRPLRRGRDRLHPMPS